MSKRLALATGLVLGCTPKEEPPSAPPRGKPESIDSIFGMAEELIADLERKCMSAIEDDPETTKFYSENDEVTRTPLDELGFDLGVQRTHTRELIDSTDIDTQVCKCSGEGRKCFHRSEYEAYGSPTGSREISGRLVENPVGPGESDVARRVELLFDDHGIGLEDNGYGGVTLVLNKGKNAPSMRDA